MGYDAQILLLYFGSLVVAVALVIIAIWKGVAWLCAIRDSGKRLGIGILELIVFLLALIPGPLLIIAIGQDFEYVIPMGAGVSVGAGSGALLGLLRRCARRDHPSHAQRVGAMLIGVLASLPFCFALLVWVPSMIPARPKPTVEVPPNHRMEADAATPSEGEGRETE